MCKNNKSKKNQVSSRTKIKRKKRWVYKYVCIHILFIHAILGCDTTSMMYGIGMARAFKLLFDCDASFVDCANVFGRAQYTVEEIEIAGENALIKLYGASCVGINDLCYRTFCQKVATSKSQVEAKSLPPTARATKHNSMRVFHQILDWKGNNVDPAEWGWKNVNGTFVAVQTNRAHDPKELLSIIRCSCKTGCSTLRCSCKK